MRHKITLLTWFSVYSLLLLVFTVFGRFLNPLPIPVRLFIVSSVLVSTVSYVVMPLLTRLFAGWLHRKV